MINELCVFLKHNGEKKAAQTLLEALSRHSNDIKQIDELAKTAFDIKDYPLAVKLAEKMVNILQDPKAKYDATDNLIISYAHANYPEKALELIEKQEKIVPNDRDRELKKAYSLFLMGRRDEAEAILRKNLESPYLTEKVKTEINFNLGTYELYKDKFQEGLYRFLIYGRKMGNWNKPALPYTMWNGEDISGKTLIILAEAGIGDEFINVRFIKHLKDRGITPYWRTSREDLHEIYEYNGVSLAKNNIEDCFWCHSMDLPILLKLEYSDLWYGPYLKPKPTDIPDIFTGDSYKIGLRWQGNIHYDNDLHRGLCLSDLMNTVNSVDANTTLYSLQRDDGVEDLQGVSGIIPLHNDTLNTFNETLNVISKLDIVITSCTSIAHAAAAMGKRTIIFTPLSAYYTWCNSWGEKSPWYGDNVTILRQVTPRSWAEPLERLKELLLSEFSNRR